MSRADRAGPPLIVPPGARSPVALATAEATAELIKPQTYPFIQGCKGHPCTFPEGQGFSLQLFVKTSPLAGRVLRIGATFADLRGMAQRLREAADKLDEIATHAEAQDPDPA